MKIIGIDFSTCNKKCAISIVEWLEGKPVLLFLGVRTGQSIHRVVETIRDDIGILAIDAPLGWPQNLGHSLTNHAAGEFISQSANSLFRRATDEMVKQVTGKQSLDVGADKIARTAHGALALIRELRSATSKPLPLAWDPNSIDEFSVIEVYPAATLKQHGIRYDGYKDKSKVSIREGMLDDLSGPIAISPIYRRMAAEDDNLLDSIVCVKAALDFINGDVVYPSDQRLAHLEG